MLSHLIIFYLFWFIIKLIIYYYVMITNQSINQLLVMVTSEGYDPNFYINELIQKGFVSF